MKLLFKYLIPKIDKNYIIKISEDQFKETLGKLIQIDKINYHGIGYDPNKFLRGEINPIERTFIIERNLGPVSSGHLTKLIGRYSSDINKINVFVTIKTSLFNYLIFLVIFFLFFLYVQVYQIFGILIILYVLDMINYHYNARILIREFEENLVRKYGGNVVNVVS